MTHLSVVMLTFLKRYSLQLAETLEAQQSDDVELVALVDAKAAAGADDDQRQVLHRLMERWRVVLHDPRGNWGQHRNSVLPHLSPRGWVVMLDDDERVTNSFLERLQAAIAWAPPSIEAFYLPRINTFGSLEEIPPVDWLNPTGLAYPDLQGRVFRNNGVIRYRGRVHEGLVGWEGIFPLMEPSLTLLHHKTEDMQARSNGLWQQRELEPRFYSQCLEDKFLDFVLTRFEDDFSNTVVELGAGHPTELSNSRYLIERGWTALLVEANPDLVDLLAVEYRYTGAVEVCDALVAPDQGQAQFHTSSHHWALSGVDGVSQPEAHGEGDVTVVERIAVTASSLITPWLGGRRLGVLVVDLEGLDTEVLREVLLAGIRPQIVIVEALTHESRVAQEELLTRYGYSFVRNLALSNVWIDGLLPRSGAAIALAQEFIYA